MLTEQKANGRFIYSTLYRCGAQITQNSQKINRKRQESANEKFCLSIYVAMQLVILTPTPTNGFCLFS
jgi:hypothetical protein